MQRGTCSEDCVSVHRGMEMSPYLHVVNVGFYWQQDRSSYCQMKYIGYCMYYWFIICKRQTSCVPLTEVVEHACSVTSLMLGETLPSITKDMDTHTYRLPLGVCAGVAPFNFPAMIPLWMFPVAMVCGNTYLLKPSERVPACAMLLAKMLQDAGAPDGTLNIIHGQHDGKTWVSLPFRWQN